jgi:hypothetical protein
MRRTADAETNKAAPCPQRVLPCSNVPDPRSDVAAALETLIARGLRLQLRLVVDAPADVRADVANRLDPGGAQKKTTSKTRKGADEDSLSEIFALNFATEYQAWYSCALPVVRQILPDRHGEFRELHRLDKRPRELDPSTYSISDYLQGIRVVRGFGREEEFSSWHVAHTKFGLQLDILRAAADRLDSALGDITGLLEAALFDDELIAARELVKSGYLRSAGVVAGVVLEHHLQRLLKNHAVPFRKKPQIASMNDALKDANVYGVAEWRRIQHLGDLRNLCCHAGNIEPSRQNVEDLMAGVQTVTSSVF